MSKAKPGKLNDELEKAMAEEVRLIRQKYAEDDDATGRKKGEFKYDVLERMRVYDRALKLEAIKLKVDGSEWGKEFGNEKRD